MASRKTTPKRAARATTARGAKQPAAATRAKKGKPAPSARTSSTKKGGAGAKKSGRGASTAKQPAAKKPAARAKRGARPAVKKGAPSTRAASRRVPQGKSWRKPPPTVGRPPGVSDEDFFWDLIETAWREAEPALLDRMKLAQRARDDEDEDALDRLQRGAERAVDVLRARLGALDAPTLMAFDRVLERKLHAIDREAVHEATDGSDDGFLYCRGFIVAMGREFYDAVDREPSRAIMDAECEAMCYVSWHLYNEKFGDMPNSGISRESFSNREGWPT